jgi:hypothetical protein
MGGVLGYHTGESRNYRELGRAERLQAMRASGRRAGLGVLAFFIAMPALVISASAQENIDAGKTPAQLYAADCAICHKTPNGMSKVGGMFGLTNFLREHYTASRESAAAIAAYLVALDRKSPPPREHTRSTRRARKGEKPGAEKAKAKEEKARKADETKPSDEPAEAKAKAEAKADAKPAETKAKADVKSDAKPEAKSEAKPESKPAEAKAAPKSEPKSEHEAKAKLKQEAKPKHEAKTNTKTDGAKAPDAKPEKKAD